MTDYSEYFHPELEAILQEIARDPEAKLLAVPTSGQLVHAMREPSVGIAAPSLTSAERELLEVYRDEVGELLKQRCLIQFFQMPDADLRWHKSVRAGEVLEVQNEREWSAETTQALGSGLSSESTRIGEDLLKRCVAGDSERPVSITQLAKAMQRVAGLEQAGVYVALDLASSGRWEAALSVTAEELAGPLTPQLSSYAQEASASCLLALGRTDEALTALRGSFLADRTRIGPLIGLLAASIEIGDLERSRDSASELDASCSEQDPGLRQYAELIRQRLRNAQWVPTEPALSCIRGLEKTSGASTQRLLASYDH